MKMSGMHADIQIDVAEVMDGFAEMHDFEVGRERWLSQVRQGRSAERRAGSPLKKSAAAQII